MLGRAVGWLDDLVRAKRSVRLPVVLSRAEVKAVLAQLIGTPWLIASLLYGSGLRLLECLRLRVKDVDFERNTILVRSGKGDRDRVTVLPALVKRPLQTHLGRVEALYHEELSDASFAVELPERWRASSRTLGVNGSGSGYFRPPGPIATRLARCVAIICTRR